MATAWSSVGFHSGDLLVFGMGVGVFVGEWVSVGKGLFVGVCVVGDTLGEGVVRMGEGSVGLGVEVEAAAGVMDGG